MDFEYKISEHCKQRYVQRILNKDNMSDINRFIVENEQKIINDIHKMITYGTCIYEGKQSQKDGRGNVLNVYLKDTWVVLVDNSAKVVVTLYKIDLGCGDDFNLQYIDKMLSKIDGCKSELILVQSAVETENTMYKELMEGAQCQINEYKASIKQSEELYNGYKTIVENNNVKISQVNRSIADVVNTLVGKREF